MRTLALILAGVLCLGAGAATAGGQVSREERIVERPADDQRMAAAVAEARRTLPVYWRRLAHPDGREQFTLQILLMGTDGHQKGLWVENIRREGDAIAGEVQDGFPNLPGYAKGDTVLVDPAIITDWGYYYDGRRYGHYTIRVIFEDMTPEQSARYGLELAPTPLEPGDR